MFNSINALLTGCEHNQNLAWDQMTHYINYENGYPEQYSLDRWVARFVVANQMFTPIDQFAYATGSIMATYYLMKAGVGYCIMKKMHVDIVNSYLSRNVFNEAVDYVIKTCLFLFV